MKNFLKINLDEREESPLKEVLLAVDQCCLELDIDFYILGALARDIWFTEQQIAARGTKDLDFAMLVRETGLFLQLKELLAKKHDFVTVKDNQFALIAPNKMQIDILPFGALEVEDGVTVEGEGLNRIKVNGFKEVYLESVREAYVLDGKSFKVATLPGIFLLKLIAFDDRPDQRQNDPVDCLSIIEKFFELQSDLIYENHNDLFGDDGPLILISARVIGREMRKPLGENADLKARVVGILKGHIDLREKSSFILQMASYAYLATEECALYLEGVLTGIQDA